MSESAQLTAGSQNSFVTDIVMAVACVVAIALAIYHPGPEGFGGPVIWILIFSAVAGLLSAASSFGVLTVRNPQDYYGGLVLVGLSIVALLASSDLPGMRGFAFGPGTAPRIFAIALALLSFVVAIGGLMTDGPAIARYVFRGPIFITLSVSCFAATIRPLGLVLASFLTVCVAAAATPEVRWKETIIWGIVLTAFCSILFPYGLNLPFQLWPRFW